MPEAKSIHFDLNRSSLCNKNFKFLTRDIEKVTCQQCNKMFEARIVIPKSMVSNINRIKENDKTGWMIGKKFVEEKILKTFAIVIPDIDFRRNYT